MDILASGPGVPISSPDSVDGGDRGLRLPNLRKPKALSLVRDPDLLLNSAGAEENPEAAEDTSDMVDWFASADLGPPY